VQGSHRGEHRPERLHLHRVLYVRRASQFRPHQRFAPTQVRPNGLTLVTPGSAGEKRPHAENTMDSGEVRGHEGCCSPVPTPRMSQEGRHRCRRTATARPAKAAALATALAAVLALLAPAARADDAPRLALDWGKFGDVLRQAPGALFPHEQRDVEHLERWVGLAPRMSLVARDWGGSQLLVGNLTLTDQMRLTHSSRMVVTRVRLAEGRLVPFAQLGLGEWRVDRTLVPALPLNQQLAAQAGAGFELAVAPSVAIALEADWTLLWDDDVSSQPQTMARPYLWGSLLAARARF
jgi:hypothetical protein